MLIRYQTFDKLIDDLPLTFRVSAYLGTLEFISTATGSRFNSVREPHLQ